MRFFKSINQPGRADVHVDRPLSNVVTAYVQDDDTFVAARAFPVVPVSKQTDLYFAVPKGAWFRDEMKKRAPGTLSAERTHDMAQDSYQCDVWALHEKLADQVRANYDDPLQPEREIAIGLAQAGLIRKERDWIDTFFKTGVWTSEVTGVDSATPGGGQFGRWDRADSTPIEDVRTGLRTVQGITGKRPQKMVCSRAVFDALLDHPDIVGRVDRGQTRGPAMVMRENLAALFEIEEILVLEAIYNSAVEGGTDSLGFMAADHALLLYAAPAPGLYAPSAGYTFAWTGLLGAGAMGLAMKRIRIEERESDMLEIQMAFDHKLVGADLGYFFLTAIN